MLVRTMIIIMVVLSVAACSDTQETASETTKTIVKFGKEVLGGVAEGIDEGRKEAKGVDGASIVTSIDEIGNDVEIAIVAVNGLSEKAGTAIEVGFKNRTEKPIRIANMYAPGNVLLIDAEGYAQGLDSRSHGSDITIPASAGIKHTFIFAVPSSKGKTLRLWNKEYPLNP